MACWDNVGRDAPSLVSTLVSPDTSVTPRPLVSPQLRPGNGVEKRFAGPGTRGRLHVMLTVDRQAIGAARWRMLTMLAGLWLALAALSGPAAADNSSNRSPSRVLPPAAGEIVARALSNMEPEWLMESVTIDRDRVSAQLCRADKSSCLAIELTDPEDGCPSEVTGPWCITYDSKPSPATDESLRQALAEHEQEEVWVALAPEMPLDNCEEATVDTPSWWDRTLPFLLALATMLLPLAAGAATGLGLRRATRRWERRRARGVATMAAVLLLLLLPLLLPPFWSGLGFWDLLQTTWLFALAMSIATLMERRAMNSRHVLMLVLPLLSLLLFEVACRFLPPAPVPTVQPMDVRLLFSKPGEMPPEMRRVYAPLYPELVPHEFDERTARVSERRNVVLHVGDSMVRGTSEVRSHPFTATLEKLEPDTAHVNGGVVDTGPDYYLALTLQWLELLSPQRVVLYFFAGNDLVDLGRPYLFCDNRTLLTYDDGQLRFRCPDPQWGGMTLAGALRGPPTYALRVAASFSAAARQMVTLGWRLHRSLFPPPELSQGLRRLTDILDTAHRELQRRQIELVVVILPYREALEGNPTSVAEGEVFRQTITVWAGPENVTVLDSWSLLAPMVARDGSDRWFLNDYPGDMHLNAEGHEILARWLHSELPPLVPPSP